MQYTSFKHSYFLIIKKFWRDSLSSENYQSFMTNHSNRIQVNFSWMMISYKFTAYWKQLIERSQVDFHKKNQKKIETHRFLQVCETLLPLSIFHILKNLKSYRKILLISFPPFPFKITLKSAFDTSYITQSKQLTGEPYTGVYIHCIGRDICEDNSKDHKISNWSHIWNKHWSFDLK